MDRLCRGKIPVFLLKIARIAELYTTSTNGSEIDLAMKPSNKHVQKQSVSMGVTGSNSLERLSANEAQGNEKGGDTVPSSKGGSGLDSQRNGQIDSEGIAGTRGLGNGEGELPISTGGASPEGQRGSEGGRAGILFKEIMVFQNQVLQDPEDDEIEDE